MTTVSPSVSSVLILNTFQPSHVPVLTDLNGNVNMNLTFEIENDAYVYNSCGVQFKGNFFIYGSLEGDRRQIAKVVDCALKRIDTLSFPFVEGACSANSNQVILWFYAVCDVYIHIDEDTNMEALADILAMSPNASTFTLNFDGERFNLQKQAVQF